jgi:DNA-directed RNA polymerase specialized sigma subunit
MKRREMEKQAHKRGRDVIRLHEKKRYKFWEIGEMLGVSASRAHQIYKAAKERQK